jgi:pyrroline-5-carboxylate reductase
MIADGSGERHRLIDIIRATPLPGMVVGQDTEVLLIGFGNMGQALARGWLATGVSPAAIRVVDTAPAARAVAETLGVAASERIDPSAVQPEAAGAKVVPPKGGAPKVVAQRVVVFAVKPHQLAPALAECRPRVGPGTVFLSIAAGKTLAQLESGLGAGAAVVRAMPNTPAAIGKGMTVLVASPAVSAAQREACADLLAAVGAVAWIEDERHMDAVTAVSGSGPAYVFLLIECLERAAMEAGLTAELARQLALATVAGAGAYAAAAHEPPAELRRRVTSPGGTTQAALDVLGSEHGLAELVARAVHAAAARSRELSAV